MKKVLAILIIGFLFLECSAQNADAQSSNDSQRIVGTWLYGGGSSFIFNDNGTYSFTYPSYTTFNHNGNYFVSGSKIVLKRNDSNSANVYDFYISPNGRILVINWSNSDSEWYEKQ